MSRKRRSPSASPGIRSRTITNCKTRCSCPFASSAITGAAPMAQRWNERRRRPDTPHLTWLSKCSGPDAPEGEGGLRFDDLAVHLKQRIGEEIDRAACGRGIDHEVAAFRQLETVGWIMAEIIAGELRILPRFTDVHRHPTFVSKQFSPTMVPFDCAFVLVRGTGCAETKPPGDAE